MPKRVVRINEGIRHVCPYQTFGVRQSNTNSVEHSVGRAKGLLLSMTAVSVLLCKHLVDLSLELCGRFLGCTLGRESLDSTRCLSANAGRRLNHTQGDFAVTQLVLFSHAQSRDDPARLKLRKAGVDIGHLHSVFSISFFAGM